MKVYIVLFYTFNEYDYENQASGVLKVFSNQENAEDYIRKISNIRYGRSNLTFDGLVEIGALDKEEASDYFMDENYITSFYVYGYDVVDVESE